MSVTWKPAIWRSGTLLELPRPVTVLRAADSFDFLRMKVPLHAGEFVEGRSENGVVITVEGQIGKQAGQLHVTEQQMINGLETLRQKLRPLTAETTFQFFIYHDAAQNTFRSFKSCTLQHIDYDLSSPQLFGYALRIHAADPKLYVTAPS